MSAMQQSFQRREPRHAVTAVDAQENAKQEVSEVPFVGVNVGNISRHYKRSFIHDWWWWELLSSAVSLAATASIVAVLAKYNGKALSTWPLPITLNSTISTLVTLAKASMLVGVAECIGQAKWNWFTQKSQKLHHFRTFDGASRGPWGSLILLFRMRWRTVFASIGAFIVFAAIGIDPFTQQVLSFPLRSTAVPESSFIQRAQFWDQNDLTYKGQSENDSLGLGMRATIYNSLLNLGNTASSLDFKCSTGNCTWEPFTTLGFCSVCRELTEPVKHKCSLIGNNWYITCTFLLPNGLQFVHSDMASTKDGNITIYNVGADFGVSATSDLFGGGETFVYDSSNVPFLGLQHPLVAIAFYSFDPINVPSSPPPTDITRPNITQCDILYCIRTLNVSALNGKLRTDVLSTWYDKNALWYGRSQSDHPDQIELRPAPAVIPMQDPGNLTFIVSSRNANQLSDYLYWIINFNMSRDAVTCLDTPKDWVWPTCSGDIAMALFHVTNLTSAMENLADRMTDQLRSISNDVAIGYTFANEAYVEVEWVWLILPIGVVLLAFGLLITAIIMSNNNASAVWKSDSLATLFHGLHSADPQLDLRHPRQMETAAKKMKVRLQYTQDGELKLVSEEAASWKEPVGEGQGGKDAEYQATHPVIPETYTFTGLIGEDLAEDISLDEPSASRDGAEVSSITV